MIFKYLSISPRLATILAGLILLATDVLEIQVLSVSITGI